MMNKRFVWVLVCAILLMALLSVVQNDVFLQNEAGEAVAVMLYFPRKEGEKMSETMLLQERRVLMVADAGDVSEVARAVVEALAAGPEEESMERLLSKEAVVRWVTYSEGWLGISFRSSLARAASNVAVSPSSATEMLSRYCIVLSLSSVSFPDGERVEQFSFYTGDELQKSPAGSGMLAAADVVESVAEAPISYNAVLYYPEAGALRAERRTIETRSNQSVEYYIVQELIKGPADDKKGSTLPDGLSAISANTEYGTCYVNVSKEFISLFEGDTEAVTLSLYSIVNSLTELDTVRTVKFLVEGQAVGELGEFDLSGYFQRDIGYSS